MSSMPSIRRWRFLTTWGSKLPLRSRGTSRSSSPSLLWTFLELRPLRELPVPLPEGS